MFARFRGEKQMTTHWRKSHKKKNTSWNLAHRDGWSSDTRTTSLDCPLSILLKEKQGILWAAVDSIPIPGCPHVSEAPALFFFVLTFDKMSNCGSSHPPNQPDSSRYVFVCTFYCLHTETLNPSPKTVFIHVSFAAHLVTVDEYLRTAARYSASLFSTHICLYVSLIKIYDLLALPCVSQKRVGSS